MRRLAITLFFSLLLWGSFGQSTLQAEEPTNLPEIAEDGRLPGVGLAEGISQVTGVAISPLLGVSGVGCWKYFTTAEEQRHLLPWFCHPAAWGIGFSILSLVFLKDSLGTGAPALLKKPLDFIELFEDKISAAIAAGTLVPYVATQMAEHFSPPEVSALGVSGNIYLAVAPALLAWILIPLCIMGFFAVWLLSHAVNVLLLLSPFGAIDAVMKLSKLATIIMMMLLYAISPVLAAILAVFIIVIAVFLAPATFRLCVFGTVMSGDYLRSLVRKSDTANTARCFLARKSDSGLKARTFGRVIATEEGELSFVSRFFFFGHKRTIPLPSADRLTIHRGILFPSLTTDCPSTDRRIALVHFLPRYRHSINSLGDLLAVTQFTDNPVVKGVKALSSWAKGSVKASRLRISGPETDTN